MLVSVEGNYFKQLKLDSQGDYICICFHFPQALLVPRFSSLLGEKLFFNVQVLPFFLSVVVLQYI